MVNNDRGVLAVPMSLILIALWTGLVGTVILMNSWKKEVHNQLRIDRCVARSSLRLKSTLDKIENINRHIQALRAALLAATLAPEAVPALKAALHAETATQDLLLIAWKTEQAAWLMKRGCDGLNDTPLPIPRLAYERPPPDPIGERALVWSSQNEELRVHLRTRRRSAAAEIIRSSNDGKWRTHFTAP